MRANSNITVDLRPAARDRNAVPVALTNSERTALEQAISTKFFDREGWRSDDRGRVLNGNGRVIFDVGFVIGLRKRLG